MDTNPNEPTQTQPEETDQGFYQPDETAQSVAPDDLPDSAPVAGSTGLEWDAVEYVHKPKGAAWIVGLVIVALLLAIFALWLHAWTFVALIIVMAIAFGVIAFRSPKTIHYKLDSQGITVGNQFYPLTAFRAFGMLVDGDLYSAMLIPLKRMMPSISVFFTEQQGEAIVDILGAQLPMEEIREEPMERLMKYLRF
jgi:hypothetical protein